jgi:DHA1 family multidrug resistance protein-like MFS transporter
MRANDDELPDPAVRLYPSAVGAILLPISLFGIGWSGQSASVHWIVPIIFSAIFPLGAMMIFPPVLGYLGGELAIAAQNCQY